MLAFFNVVIMLIKCFWWLIIPVLIIFFPAVRCAVFNPIKTIKNAFIDFFNWCRYKQWNNAYYGFIDCYTGLFGRGKTLSATHRVISLYNRYNGKRVYDPFRKKWVTQVVCVLSNVNLTSIPYIHLDSMFQAVEYSKNAQEYDLLHDTLTITYTLIDEASTQLNSRSFKTNFSNPLLLNTILTSRHWKLGFILTSQRFNHMDALMRQVTQNVINCKKVWRFQLLNYYDAWELENSTNIELVKPIRRTCWFVTNKDYANYDTHACVDTLSKDPSDQLSSEEVMNLLGYNPDADTVVHTSRRAKKRKFGKH